MKEEENILICIGEYIPPRLCFKDLKSPYISIGFEQSSKYWRVTPWLDFMKDILHDPCIEDFEIRINHESTKK